MHAATKASLLMLAAVLAIAAWDHSRRRAPPRTSPPAAATLAQPAAGEPRDAEPAAPTWVLAPDDYGDDLPPAGRSLFDARIAALGGASALPYPFERLLARLDGDARCPDLPDGRCLVRVLIPVGRSLQRLAAAPDFFAHPRIVAAMAGEPTALAAADGFAPLQRDRLYLGHVDGSGLIEVISYNDAAARFEFQLVHDYRPGGTPRVVQAPRALCLACHQNHAPIFSRPLWLETNANPAVAARLVAHAERFDGVPARRGVDLPAAIDAATDRANLFSLWQTLWRTGCGDGDAGTRCRTALFEAALQYRANRGHGYDERLRATVRPAFAAAWRQHWPNGLALPDPDIPNRDPLSDDRAGPALRTAAPGPAGDGAYESAAPSAQELAQIPAQFEPLVPRTPLEVWLQPDDAKIDATVAGLAEFLGDDDRARLDAAVDLHRVGERQVRLACAPPADTRAARLELRCGDASQSLLASLALAEDAAGGRSIVGGTATLTLAGERAQADLQLRAVGDAPSAEARSRSIALTVGRAGAAARTAAGHRIERIELRRAAADAPGEAIVTLREDYAAVSPAVAAIAGDRATRLFEPGPFRRGPLVGALLAALGAAPPPATGAPTALASSAPVDTPAFPPSRVAGSFQRFCTPCHRTPSTSPPNFLLGDEATVEARLRQCAARIRYRLAMWQLPVALRPKTPMPPEQALSRLGAEPRDWPASAELAALAAYAARLDGGGPPAMPDNYETLRACLPASG